MKINNPLFFRLSERLREDRILCRNIGGRIQPPLKLVERGDCRVGRVCQNYASDSQLARRSSIRLRWDHA